MSRITNIDDRQLMLLNELIMQNNTNMQQLINVYSNNQTMLNNYMTLMYRSSIPNNEIPNTRTRSFSPSTNPIGLSSLFSVLLNPNYGDSQTLPTERINYNIVKYSDISNEDMENEDIDIIEYENISQIDSPINDTCVISREPFDDSTIIHQINRCKHNFKKSFLQQWITLGHNNCPYCRMNIREN